MRLHRLDGAVVADEEFAFPIRPFQQRKPLAIRADAGMAFDERRLAQAKMRGDAGDFGIGQAHLPRPAAASRATLTFMEYRHGAISPANIESGNTLSIGKDDRRTPQKISGKFFDPFRNFP